MLSDDLKKYLNSVETKAYESKKKLDQSSISRAQKDISALQKFFAQFIVGCHWIWIKILEPMSRWFILKPFVWIFKLYRLIWSKVVYTKDQYDTKVFSKVRAGVTILVTLLFIWATPDLVSLTMDSALYAATSDREIVYLNNSQEINYAEGVHSIQGCYKIPCTEDDSIYYRVRPTLFNHIWAIFHEGKWFFPDAVAAAVPPVVSECHIHSYGIRLKLFMRGFDVYPDLLTTSCKPLLDKVGTEMTPK